MHIKKKNTLHIRLERVQRNEHLHIKAEASPETRFIRACPELSSSPQVPEDTDTQNMGLQALAALAAQGHGWQTSLGELDGFSAESSQVNYVSNTFQPIRDPGTG